MAQIDKTKLNKSYRKTMSDAHSETRTSSRLASYFFHASFVEKFIALLNIILWPRAIIVGSALAIIVLAGEYFSARFYNLAFSGSETILAFLAGYVIALFYDVLLYLFKRFSN